MNTDINNEKLSFKSMYDLVEEFDAHNKPGIKTGLKEFDDLVGGEFIKGKVYALSSTPDMCAVDFAYLVLNAVANKQDPNVGYIALQKSCEDVGVNLIRQRSPFETVGNVDDLSENDSYFMQAVKALDSEGIKPIAQPDTSVGLKLLLEKLRRAPLMVMDRSFCPEASLSEMLVKLHDEAHVDMVFIDHIDDDDAFFKEGRQLRETARALGIVLVLISKMVGDVESFWINHSTSKSVMDSVLMLSDMVITVSYPESLGVKYDGSGDSTNAAVNLSVVKDNIHAEERLGETNIRLLIEEQFPDLQFSNLKFTNYP